MKHEGWVVAAGRLGTSLSTEQADQLDALETLLIERAAPAGMIASADVPRLRERHIMDSLRAAAHVDGARSAYDLGSGAGLPGLPLAIASPSLDVVLVEARRGRAAFLELARDALGLANVTVFPGRVEALSRRVELITARAFADAVTSWNASEPLLAEGGRLVYFAGIRFAPATEAPEGVVLTLFPTPRLARSGPLAIMGRQ